MGSGAIHGSYIDNKLKDSLISDSKSLTSAKILPTWNDSEIDYIEINGDH